MQCCASVYIDDEEPFILPSPFYYHYISRSIQMTRSGGASGESQHHVTSVSVVVDSGGLESSN